MIYVYITSPVEQIRDIVYECDYVLDINCTHSSYFKVMYKSNCLLNLQFMFSLFSYIKYDSLDELLEVHFIDLL